MGILLIIESTVNCDEIIISKICEGIQLNIESMIYCGEIVLSGICEVNYLL